MKTKGEFQRYGRIKEAFNGFGELREQKRPPHKEVWYVSIVDSDTLNREIRLATSVVPRKLWSINNSSNEQLDEAIRYITIEGLNAGRLTQEQAEKLLDACYAELNRRMQDGNLCDCSPRQ